MRLPSHAAIVLAACALAGCQPSTGPDAGGAVAQPTLHVAPWPLPAPDGASLPDLATTPDGALLLSWVEPDADGHVLRFARHDAGGWSATNTIARGDDWFVNWADIPHVAATADGAVWGQWLRKTADAPYAYDVVLARSGDGGATWSAPVTVNDDGTPTEHGFASLWPAGADRIGIAWLDGRATGGGHAGHDGHGAGGAMTLRSATFDAGLARSGETRVDASTCDCCRTGVALAGDTPLLAYRGRTADEVRDIQLVRRVDGAWSAPRPVHADGWVIPGCPINGPALATHGDAVVVAWYTEAGGQRTVRMARSDDAGATFAVPQDLDTGEAVLGRTAVGADAAAAWVAWLREDGDRQVLRVVRHPHADAHANAHDDRHAGAGPALAVDAAHVAGRGRGTGFPQLVVLDGRAHLAWTEVVDGRPRLRGAVVDAR